MAIGKTNAIAAASKKCASGTFTGNGMDTYDVTLDFTPRYVSYHIQKTTTGFPSSTAYGMSYDFTTSVGIVNASNLGYSGLSSSRPTFSGGTLTLKGIILTASFNSSYTYTWFAQEA